MRLKSFLWGVTQQRGIKMPINMNIIYDPSVLYLIFRVGVTSTRYRQNVLS